VVSERLRKLESVVAPSSGKARTAERRAQFTFDVDGDDVDDPFPGSAPFTRLNPCGAAQKHAPPPVSQTGFDGDRFMWVEVVSR
jgi:hypothetical protein